MNRRDAALIAHLDAIESRLTLLLTHVIDEQQRQRDILSDIRADIAGMKMEHATHTHTDD